MERLRRWSDGRDAVGVIVRVAEIVGVVDGAGGASDVDNRVAVCVAGGSMSW